MKKLLIVAASVAVAGFLSTASLAAKTTSTLGFRIFNQNQSLDYTAANSSPCTGAGVTFPTPIAHNANGVISIAANFNASGKVCSVQYTNGASTCLVSLVSNQMTGKVKVYAQALSGISCYAINGHTAVTLQ